MRETIKARTSCQVPARSYNYTAAEGVRGRPRGPRTRRQIVPAVSRIPPVSLTLRSPGVCVRYGRRRRGVFVLPAPPEHAGPTPVARR